MPAMENRNIVAFNFVRRQSETALMNIKRSSDTDHNANMKQQHLASIRKGGVGRSLTFTPRDSTTPRVSMVTQRVVLPERFRRKIRRKNSSNNLLGSVIANGTSLTNIDETDLDEKGLDWEDRKSDMERAITWVKQELQRLREQDRVLVKRFLDLHTTMQQSQAIRSCPTLDVGARSHTSLSTASWLSLDDGHFGYAPVHQRDQHDGISIDLSQCSQTNHHLHKLVMAHCSNMRDLNVSHSDSDLQARTVSLSDIYSGESGGRFAKYIQDSPEMGRFAKYNRAALSQPESLDEDSEDEYNNTLTKQPHFRIDTEYEDNSENALENASSGDDYDEIFSSEYTDTLTKAPSFTSAGGDESFECDSLEEYDCDTLTRNKDKKREIIIDTGLLADEIS